MMVMMMKFYGQPVLKHYWLLPGLRFVHFSSLSSQPSLPVLILVSVKKMLESRPENALVNTVETVETVETVTVETVGRDCRDRVDWRSEKSIAYLVTDNLKARDASASKNYLNFHLFDVSYDLQELL